MIGMRNKLMNVKKGVVKTINEHPLEVGVVATVALTATCMAISNYGKKPKIMEGDKPKLVEEVFSKKDLIIRGVDEEVFTHLAPAVEDAIINDDIHTYTFDRAYEDFGKRLVVTVSNM